MHALDQLGITKGERVATLAWNSYRHLECYFGVPCSGRILHTLNLRLSTAELGWIIADADDRALLVDLPGPAAGADPRGRPSRRRTHRGALRPCPRLVDPAPARLRGAARRAAGELPASRYRRAQPARTLLHVGDDSRRSSTTSSPTTISCIAMSMASRWSGCRSPWAIWRAGASRPSRSSRASAPGPGGGSTR
jgi:hypothetical protein